MAYHSLAGDEDDKDSSESESEKRKSTKAKRGSWASINLDEDGYPVRPSCSLTARLNDIKWMICEYVKVIYGMFPQI